MIRRARWYLNRLSRMSTAEFGFRIGRTLRAQAERIGLGLPRDVPPPVDAGPGISLLIQPEGLDSEPYLERADQVSAGRFDVFALKATDLGSPPRWNRDPSTGIEAPMHFGKTLNYRDPSLVGDIKYLWEPNRHLHLVTLAQAYRLSGADKYLYVIREHLFSWFEQCPFPRGPNWTSSLELAIRLINWACAWSLLADDSPLLDGGRGKELRRRWLESIYRHCWFIRHHFSRHSSANNHLIGEAAGLLVAALTWPCWPETVEWKKSAAKELETEVQAQNGADGVNREQAIAYQQFVLDFLILAGRAMRLSGADFPEYYWGRIESMIEFIGAIMDRSGHVPMIGDDDNGCVVGLDPKASRSPFHSLLATGSVLFGRGDFKRKSKGLDDKTLWLLGNTARETFAELPCEQGSWARAFREGGYYVLGADLETPEEIRLVVDAGPLGYLSIAAHGHADALAFTLSVSGREMLIDPGTYAYHTKKRWRDYFRGTRAHNTVAIDSRDQSEIGGNFLWLSKAEAHCELWQTEEGTETFQGVHDGYLRLPDPVLHRRTITLDKADRTVLVEDTLDCSGRHDAEICYHFAESCHVTRRGQNAIVARSNDVSLRLLVSGTDGELCLFHGDSERPAGWISRSFDVKVPTTTAIWRTSIEGPTTIATLISCNPVDLDETDPDV